ncbi:MAG TPA: 8-amino-7-oxononanoate synthase [Chthoniobacteraceae bacterium]|jgi:8-amino-7-oxononanoate synthase|nr:8-amino-7-oxononanoate synthase [Chthoniobacteraceae bacterium]
MKTVESQLADIRSRALLRTLRHIDTAQQPETVCDGRPLINFSSNDYLGLAADPILREAAKRCIDQWGVGAGASRLVCGGMGPHAQLERDLAAFKRCDAALVFSSGYATALGALGALAGPEDVIVLDKLAHASLIDGARLSRATLRVFPHNHLGKLESHLRWARENLPQARVIIVTESVFSMDGDRAPIEEIVAIKNRYGALLLLDEAHGVGVIGDAGRGLADKRGVAHLVDIQMGTLGKALGSAGGYICARRPIIDLLINRARSFIYSTAPLPAAAAAASAAIAFLQTPAGRERQERLWQRIGDFMRDAPESLLPAGPVQSAIIPLILGDEERAVAASQWLREKGFLAPAIRYPTVARGTARLRVTISAAHTQEHVGALCAALARMGEGIYE